jgi:ABC-type phosphate transport system substrate-binding protein
MRSRLAKLAIATATVAAAAAVFAGTAQADPPASYTPGITDIAGVGSDTTEFVGNFLTWGADVPTMNPPTSGFNSVHPPAHASVDSWNATGTTPIGTKPGCLIARPNGSSAGITALINTPFSTVSPFPPCIDFARFSGPHGTVFDRNGNPLQFLPFATDRLQYATSHPTPAFPTAPVTNAPQNLTAAQLKTIYTTTGIRWTAVGGTSIDVIKKLIPQAGSETRSIFESSLGITDAQLAADVVSTQANDPAPIRASADAIAPFSDALFIHLDSNAGIQLDGNPPNPPTGFSTTYTVYFVVPLDPATLAVPGYLQPFFGDGSGNVIVNSTTLLNWVCGPAGKAIIASEGFKTLPNGNATGDCGVA